MNDFLGPLKADLLDSRMRLALAVLALALVGAAAYAILGGNGSSAPSPSAPVPLPSGVAGISITAPSSAQDAVSETTNGSSTFANAPLRDPFTPLPEPKAAAASASAATSGSSPKPSPSSPSSSSPSSSSSSKSSGSSAPAPASTPPAKPKPNSSTVYRVALKFGVVPSGTPAKQAQLTLYEDVARLTPLPNSDQPLVVFRGVNAGGASVTFSIVGEVILRGNATCVPSTSQCQAIELKPGQIEELEYAPPAGAAVTYGLALVGISASKASAASAASLYHNESKAGRRLLLRLNRAGLPGLLYSPEHGVIEDAAPGGQAASK